MDKDVGELLSRGVGEFVDPEGLFKKKLQTDPKRIIIKFGVDPTRPDLHLGHAVILRKLRSFQDLGCKVIFLIGDITAEIGDPTGKSLVRPEVQLEEINRNMQSYLDQVGKILNMNPEVFEWTKNSDWFVSIHDILAPERTVEFKENDKVVYTSPILPQDDVINKATWWIETRKQKKVINNYSLRNLLAVLRNITLAQLEERSMFQERIKSGSPVFMHEMLYPVLQGIDSNVISNIYGTCDLEVGGTDQHFNMLVGREVMMMNKKVPQSVLSFKLLEGTDGEKKMSKSLDNYIGITEEPNDIYGKIMSVPDSSIRNYFELCTYTPLDEVEKIIAGHPKEAKMRLAREVVSIYHGEDAARKAEESFGNTFSKGGVPEDVKSVTAQPDEPLVDILIREGVLSSKSEFTRLEKAGAIKEIEPGTYRIGKYRFIKIGRK